MPRLQAKIGELVTNLEIQAFVIEKQSSRIKELEEELRKRGS
jgi:hypothetical protein